MSDPDCLTDIIGSRSGAYEMKMQQARDMALQQMVHKAQALVANAVVGVDIDYEVVGDNMMMVSVSGTAVRIESTGSSGERAPGPQTAT